MRHYVKIEGDTVVNRTMFEDAMPEGWGDGTWVEHETAQIGWTMQGGELVPPNAPDKPDLDRTKAALIGRLRSDADSRMPARGIHAEKFAQATGILAIGHEKTAEMTSADLAEQFPLVAASIGLEGETAWDCANLFAAKYTEATMRAAAVERVRLVAEKAVKAANTEGDAMGIVATVEWP